MADVSSEPDARRLGLRREERGRGGREASN